MKNKDINRLLKTIYISSNNCGILTFILYFFLVKLQLRDFLGLNMVNKYSSILCEIEFGHKIKTFIIIMGRCSKLCFAENVNWLLSCPIKFQLKCGKLSIVWRDKIAPSRFCCFSSIFDFFLSKDVLQCFSIHIRNDPKINMQSWF